MDRHAGVGPVIRPEELDEMLGVGGVRLLDVRTPGEYEAVHIRGAYNVPLDTLGEHGAEIGAHVSEPVVLICQTGGRARQAEEALRTAGMPNLHVLDGGVNGWVAAGRPVERGATRLPLERQVRMVAGALVATGAVLSLTVAPAFAWVPLAVGSGLVFAGATNSCAMGMVLARLPYNRPATCDVSAMVRALKGGLPPAGVGQGGSPSSSGGPVECAG